MISVNLFVSHTDASHDTLDEHVRSRNSNLDGKTHSEHVGRHRPMLHRKYETAKPWDEKLQMYDGRNGGVSELYTTHEQQLARKMKDDNCSKAQSISEKIEIEEQRDENGWNKEDLRACQSEFLGNEDSLTSPCDTGCEL
jgi:hypothetical protein